MTALPPGSSSDGTISPSPSRGVLLTRQSPSAKGFNAMRAGDAPSEPRENTNGAE